MRKNCPFFELICYLKIEIQARILCFIYNSYLDFILEFWNRYLWHARHSWHLRRSKSLFSFLLLPLFFFFLLYLLHITQVPFIFKVLHTEYLRRWNVIFSTQKELTLNQISCVDLKLRIESGLHLEIESEKLPPPHRMDM